MTKFIEVSMNSLHHIHNLGEALLYVTNIAIFFLIVMLFINMIDNKREGIYYDLTRKIDDKRHNLYVAYAKRFKAYRCHYTSTIIAKIFFISELIVIILISILIKEEFELLRNNAFNYLCVFVVFYAIGFTIEKIKQ